MPVEQYTHRWVQSLPIVLKLCSSFCPCLRLFLRPSDPPTTPRGGLSPLEPSLLASFFTSSVHCDCCLSILNVDDLLSASRVESTTYEENSALTKPAFYAAMFPNSTFLLFFIVPLPAWALVGGVFAWDAYGAIVRPGSGTDSAGHVGGILAGLIAAGLTRRRMGGRFGRF